MDDAFEFYQPWRLAAVWSSADTRRQVVWLVSERSLEGQATEERRVESHRDFVRWLTPRREALLERLADERSKEAR